MITNTKVTIMYESDNIHKPRFAHERKVSKSDVVCNSKVFKSIKPFSINQEYKETKNRVNIIIRNHSQMNQNQ